LDAFQIRNQKLKAQVIWLCRTGAIYNRHCQL
jgi:hypothetical protein